MPQLEYVRPIKGAARYFAGLDAEKNNKPSVYMDADGHLSVIDDASTLEKAKVKANKWQIKENLGVQVEALRVKFPGHSDNWYKKYIKFHSL